MKDRKARYEMLLRDALVVQRNRDSLLAQHGADPVYVLVCDGQIAGGYRSEVAALTFAAETLAEGTYTVHEITARPKRVGGLTLGV